jgi:hypothetical protein
MHETHLVDSGCDHRTARVSLRCNPSTHVNQVHDTAAQEVPERIGIQIATRGPDGPSELKYPCWRLPT